MFKRLLLPVDLTDKHASVVATAADLAQHAGGSMTLLHVIELIPGLSREEDRDFYVCHEIWILASVPFFGTTEIDSSYPCLIRVSSVARFSWFHS
jgi:hypothetical protein